MTKLSRFSVIAAIFVTCLGATTAHAQGNVTTPGNIPILSIPFPGLGYTLSNVVYVGTCGPSGVPSTTTIQAGINEVLTGGTVWVCPGTYKEQVDIDPTQPHQGNIRLAGVTGWNLAPVILTSPTAGLVANATDLANGQPVAAQIVVKNGTYVKISGFVVDGTGNKITNCATDIRGIYFQNTSGTIQGVVTQNQTLAPAYNYCYSGAGIFAQGGYGSSVQSNVDIQGNTVQSFQKNGITADGTGVTFNINTNTIFGQGPTSGAQEYGIQVSEGATGQVIFNSISNLIATPAGGVNTANVAVGTLIYASNNVQFRENATETTQYGLLTVSDPLFGYPGNPNGTSNNTNIFQNLFTNTQNFDAIDTCSNNNTIQDNLVFFSTESAIHLDSTCGGPSGINNLVQRNVIDTACAGILEGTTPNTINNNLFISTQNQVLAGDVCPDPPPTPITTALAKRIPQPYR
jgi:hypothetical protein